MTSFELTDLPVDGALNVWHELSLALAGKNGYGGDVAEIYAYLLLPGGASAVADAASVPAEKQALAKLAGTNMARLLRRFIETHEGVVIAIQESRDEFRPLDLEQDFPPFDWRIHLRVSQTRSHVVASTQKLHAALAAIAALAEHHGVLTAALDELVLLRAKERLLANAKPPVNTEDLPPDVPTGLYLDVPFGVHDFEWIKMAWDAYAARNESSARPDQLMLVFQAIRRDERATTEFLRVMNTIVLPLLRRLRLKEQPHLSKLGAAS